MALRKVAPVTHHLPSTARRVLYVEDEDMNWEVAEASVSKHHHIRRARTAKEAAAMLASERFDLIFMDIQLAGSELDGIELTRLLTGRDISQRPTWAFGLPKQVPPIVFVTAFSARYKPEELLAQGGAEVAYKPLDFPRLLGCITKLTIRGSIDGAGWL